MIKAQNPSQRVALDSSIIKNIPLRTVAVRKNKKEMQFVLSYG